MAIPSTAQSFQVLISSEDSVQGAKNDFRVNILGDLNVDQEYYVRLLAADIRCATDGARMVNMCTIHANFGQQSVMSSNAQNRTNFLGVYADPRGVTSASSGSGGHGRVEAQPYIRCSRPNLGEVNVQIREATTGALAVPGKQAGSGGDIESVSLLVEFIPINYNRVRADHEGYVVPML